MQVCQAENCPVDPTEVEFHVHSPRICKKCFSKRKQELKKESLQRRLERGEPIECSSCKTVKPLSEFSAKSYSKCCKRCTCKKNIKYRGPTKKDLIETLTEQIQQLTLERDEARQAPRGDSEADPASSL